jgi:hypothetical protein
METDPYFCIAQLISIHSMLFASIDLHNVMFPHRISSLLIAICVVYYRRLA